MRQAKACRIFNIEVKFQFVALLLKKCHREPVTDVTGVAIPFKFAACCLKSMGIATSRFALLAMT